MCSLSGDLEEEGSPICGWKKTDSDCSSLESGGRETESTGVLLGITGLGCVVQKAELQNGQKDICFIRVTVCEEVLAAPGSALGSMKYEMDNWSNVD